jgi:hypothetical protein
MAARACKNSWSVRGLHPTAETRHVTDRASLAEMGDPEETPCGRYIPPLPELQSRHVPRSGPPPPSCAAPATRRKRLGREDARKARFRTAAQMVAMGRGLELPAREGPYVLRAAKMSSQE